MHKQSKGSVTLIAISMLFYLSGGIAWFLLAMIFADYGRFAVPVAAISAMIGTVLLIFNAFIHPESIPRPDVRPPEINFPPEIGGYYRPRTAYTETHARTPGNINMGGRPFRNDGRPLTKKQQIYGALCLLLWITVFAVYMLVSFATGRWEITWIIFLGTAFLHTLLWLIFSIKGWE